MFAITGGGVAQEILMQATNRYWLHTIRQRQITNELLQNGQKTRLFHNIKYLDAKVAYENAQTAFNMVGKNTVQVRGK